MSLSVDGGEAALLKAGNGAAAEQVTYSIQTPTALSDYIFASKWVVNGEGTPFDSTGSMTVRFAQTDGKHLYDVSSVSVNGTDFVETKNPISLTSCWNTVDGQYNLWIEDKTTGALTANGTAAADGIIDIENVSDKADIEFKKGKWTLKKPVSDLANGPLNM